MATSQSSGMPSAEDHMVISERVEHTARRHPDLVALEQDGRTMTYGELDAAANRLAQRLHRLGVVADERIAVGAHRSIETVVAFLGILKAGGAYVPINPDDPQARIEFLIDDAGARVGVVQEQYADHLTQVLPEVVILDAELTALADETDEALHVKPTPGDLAYVLYTSGSTGRPKGVAIEHRNVVARIDGAPQLLPRRGERMLHASELDFDPTMWEIWGLLFSGGHAVVAPPGRPEPSEIAALIRSAEVTISLLTPGLFHQIVELDVAAIRQLRLLMVGGDVMSPFHASRFLATPGSCRLINVYGPAEITSDCTWHEVTSVAPGASIPIGVALGQSQLYVVGEDGALVPEGEVGELLVGGPEIARGYLNRPELTAERFVPDIFDGASGTRLYRTGDRVRVDAQGVLEFLGRFDHQVKIRDFRIEPGEIEQQIQIMSGVKDVAVIARDDVPGHLRLVAYVVGESGMTLDLGQIRRQLEDRVSAHMVPSAFVALTELPLTVRGKLDRAALPAPGDSGRGDDHEVQRDQLIVQIAEVWADVLGLNEVGPEDDFLELGGDSLLAVRILVMLRALFGVDLPVESVLTRRTVSGLAIELRDRLGDPSAAVFPPIESIGDDAQVSVSPSQLIACLATELAEDALPYQFQAAVTFEGYLDVGALERTLTKIVQRHEVFHTRYIPRNGTWWPVVEDAFRVTLPLKDVSEAIDPQAACTELATELFSARLHIEKLPLIKWRLVRLRPDYHVLLHVEHHLVHDGWSWGVFLRDLTAMYRSETGQGPELPESTTVRYRDFSAWQSEFAESQLGRSQLEYWSTRLSNLPPPLQLPYDRPRPPRTSYRGDLIVLRLPATLVRGLRRVSVNHGVTPYVTMLSAFVALLHRASRDEDIVIGSGMSNRRQRDTEDLIGMLINTVALRFDVSGDPTVAELFEQTRHITLGALTNQEIPFEKVFESLNLDRQAGAMPVYQTLFSFQDPPFVNLTMEGLRVTPDVTPANGSSKADLNVVVEHDRVAEARLGASGLSVLWQYSTDLFDRGTAEALLNAYVAILEAIVEEPNLQLSQIPLLQETGRPNVQLGSRHAGNYERDASIVEVFSERVADAPDAIALEGSGRILTYRQLDLRARHVAHHLREIGVSRHDRVAVLLPRSPEAIVVLLGILMTGATYVALDPNHPKRYLSDLLTDASPSALCTFTRIRGLLPDGPTPVLTVDDLLDVTPLSEFEPPSVTAEAIAYVSFTSGSTGDPKGVEVTHRGVIRLVRETNYVSFGPLESILGMAPLAFDASTFEVWGALLNGARLVLAPPGVLSTTVIADTLAATPVTTMWLTAALFHLMVDDSPDALRGVRQLIAGGDVLSPDHVNRALLLLPPDGVLVNGYGPTEGTTFTTCHRMLAGSRVPGRVPIGRPIHNTAAYVVDELGALVPDGIPGELWIGGDGVAAGYLNRSDLTQQSFIPDPFSPDPDARLYRSGDLVRRRYDGVFEFLGRIDSQVKIRGVRVELGAVERELVGHPAVAEAAVVADRSRGIDARLVAYVVERQSGVGITGLRTYLADRLPAQFIPSDVVVVETLPITQNGKVDVRALPALVATSNSKAASSRPLNALETRMVEIWQDVLNVRPIGPRENFFDCGGHSLKAVELFASIEREMGPRLPLASIFDAPTVEKLCERVAQEGWGAPWEPLVVLNRLGSRPPFFCVSAGDGNTVGFGALARRMTADQPFYALQPRGLDGRQLLRRDIESMAADNVKAIQSVQRHGPYFLGGRCLGGLISYEMARQLREKGEEIALLAVLDSLGPRWAPRLLANGIQFDEVMNLARLRAQSNGQHPGDIFHEPFGSQFVDWLREPVFVGAGTSINRYLYEAYQARPDVRLEYPDLAGEDLSRLVEWGWVSGRVELGMNPALLPELGRDGSGPRRPKPGWRRGVDRGRERTLDLIDVASRGKVRSLGPRRYERLQVVSSGAANVYRALPYDGRITLVRSNEFLGNIEIARWYGVDSAGIDESFIAVSHRSMLREPDVAILADNLKDLMDGRLDRGTERSVAS